LLISGLGKKRSLIFLREGKKDKTDVGGEKLFKKDWCLWGVYAMKGKRWKACGRGEGELKALPYGESVGEWGEEKLLFQKNGGGYLRVVKGTK